MNFSVDKENKKINVEREFAAPISKVWAAWTESHLLEQWWAPKPWKAETKTMDFRAGGFWLYAMVGPNGEKHWARLDFKKIDVNKYFEAADTFCDENGMANSDLPGMDWRNEFLTTDNGTKVVVVLTFKNLSDLEKLIEMGFKEGFIAALGNLDDLF